MNDGITLSGSFGPAADMAAVASYRERMGLSPDVELDLARCNDAVAVDTRGNLYPKGHRYVEPDPGGKWLLQHPRIHVWQGTWQSLLSAHPDMIFDGVFSDPPFTGHVQDNIRSVLGSSAKAVEAVRQGRADVKIKKYDLNFKPLAGYEHVPALLKRTRRFVVLFCALGQFESYTAAAGGWWSEKKTGERGCFLREGIWRKKNAAPSMHGRWPGNSCEGVAIMHGRGNGLSKKSALYNALALPAQWNGANGKRGCHAYWKIDDEGNMQCSHTEDRTLHEFGDDSTSGYLEQCDECGDVRPPGCGWMGLVDPKLLAEFGVWEEGRERGQKRHGAQKPKGLCDKMAPQFVSPGECWADLWAGSGNMWVSALDAGAGSVVVAECDPEWAQHNADRAKKWLEEHQ